ncbi:MAG: signal recognition particle-docking protein FtsY [Legionella sp.]
MIKWFKRNQNIANSEQLAKHTDEKSWSQDLLPSEPELANETKQSFFVRLKQGLSRTRDHLGDSISQLLLGKKEIDAAVLDELETALLKADVGIETSNLLIEQLSEGLARKQLANGDEVFTALKSRLHAILTINSIPLNYNLGTKLPFVILMVGVNGAGKTTTIGKLAKQFQEQGKKVMLAAGDTFRAAAVEQLQVWGQRNDIPVIAQHTGADSASVIFDALQAAQARGMDILIADTAGRLHTQHNLMDELKKIKRVLKKLDPDAPHETMLVLDASIGQNALNQAKQFHQEIGLTGIAMTKLDGTAKGGILFAIANQLKIPFRYVGIGEHIEDLRPFEATQFVDAIFNHDQF